MNAVAGDLRSVAGISGGRDKEVKAGIDAAFQGVEARMNALVAEIEQLRTLGSSKRQMEKGATDRKTSKALSGGNAKDMWRTG